MKNKIDIVKIKGIIGIVLIISMTVFVRLTNDYNLTSDERYWEGMFILFYFGFAAWLIQDYVKRWFGQK